MLASNDLIDLQWVLLWNFETISTPGRRQSKTPILSRNVDQQSLETEFSIAFCRHIGDKLQSKTLFLPIFASFVDC